MLIFTIKGDSRHECRIIARGVQQKLSRYKQDLLSIAVHYYALMTCLATALDNVYDIIQIDISSAYLYVPLQEVPYIFSSPHINLVNKVFNLQKLLYGIKQAGANWYSKIIGLLQDECNMEYIPGWSCSFHLNEGTSQVILCLFVNDIILITNYGQLTKNLTDKISNMFEKKIIYDGTNKINNFDIFGLEIEYYKGKSLKNGNEHAFRGKTTKTKSKFKQVME